MKTIKYAITLLALVVSMQAQEIGIAPTKLWSDNYEIENPFGFSIYYYQPVGKLALKLEYVSAKNERNYFGLLNGGFLIDPEDFVQDDISSKSTFRAIEISCHIPELFEVLQNSFSVGAGISFDKFTRDKTGLGSGTKYSLSENKFGLFYSVSLSHKNIFGLPVKLEILFKHKGLMEGNYATDSDQPFAGAMDVKELQFNFAYVF